MKRAAVFLLLLFILFPTAVQAKGTRTFRLLTTPENELLVQYVERYCANKNVSCQVTYMGDIDCINELSVNSGDYDAVWLSNSMWLYRLDNTVSVTNSKSTGIVPIVVGVRPEVYQPALKTMEDILALDGKFGIPSITRTDSGASSFIGIYSAFSNSPRMLTMEHAKDQAVGKQVSEYISQNGTVYLSYEELSSLVQEGEHDYFFGYESDFIRLNQEYGTVLQLIYPEDGVPLADKPFAYVDHKDAEMKALFLEIQEYLLTNDVQKQMCTNGIRTGYGGLVPYADKQIFNSEWGIDTDKYLATMNYPSKDVITTLLNFYTVQVSKPANYVFCLDYSGSMLGDGHQELVDAMTTLFDERISSKYFIQMKETDHVTLILFSSSVNYKNSAVVSYSDFANIPSYLRGISPAGGTDIYLALQEAIQHVLPDSSGYNNYVVLLTDGQSSLLNQSLFTKNYAAQEEAFPIYSIMMGDADEKQLKTLAEMSGGKIFDGKTDLILAFKTLRGYN